MNHQSSPRQLNYPHLVLIAGLLLSLFVVMFRPSGAEAVLPKYVDVFETSDTDEPSGEVPLSGLGEITEKYDVVLNGKKSPTEVELTGVPLIKFLERGGVKTENVQFVKVRFGGPDDSLVAIYPLNQGSAARPPMILSSGRKPGLGPFPTPSVVPGQPDPSKPIYEKNFGPFSAKGPRIQLVPGKPGAKQLTVTIPTPKKKKNGQYSLTANVQGGKEGEIRTFQWYKFDGKGNPIKLGTSRTIETDDATTGTSERLVTVIVTERNTGSEGTSSIKYNSRKEAKGAKKDPYPKADPTPTTTNNTNPGAGLSGGLPGPGAASSIPDSTTNEGIPSPTPSTSDTPTPTDSTSSAALEDTSAITNAAQNVSGTGGLKTVTGVLLSSPTVAPIAANGGSPIAALPDPVVDQLNSIFQPVDDVDDAWAYLLALLFAFTFSGAVREWVKP